MRAAAGRMKARAESAERAAGRAMLGSRRRGKEDVVLQVSTERVAGWRGKKGLGRKSSSSFVGPTRESRGNHVRVSDLLLFSIPLSHSPSAPLYACSDSYTAQLQQPLEPSDHTQEWQHPYPSNTPRTEPQISERTLPLSSRISITLQVQVPRYALQIHKRCD